MPLRPPRHLRLVPLAAALWLAGCIEVPELDATVPDSLRDADYPALLPLDPSLFAGDTPEQEAAAIKQDLAARRERLQRRADALGAPVIDAETQARMQGGVNR